MRFISKLILAVTLLCMGSVFAQEGDAEAFRDAFLAGELSWDEVLKRAQTEGEINWFHWGGSDELNFWVEQEVKPALAELGITLQSSRVPDTRDAVDQVLADEATGRGLGAGSVDAIWINGENFLTLAQQDLLFGAFADKLPNSQYFYLEEDDPKALINRRDNGFPTELKEVPWAQFQYTCMVDTQRLPREDAPRTVEALETFLQNNPGRFTYVRPPDYIGNTFVQSVLYALSPEDATAFLEPLESYTPEEFAQLIAPGLEYLRRIEPFLLGGSGQEGVRGNPIYPENQAANESFFINGEVDMLCQMGAFTAAVGVQNGRFSETTENVVFPKGNMLANKSFIAVPSNAPHPAAALVLANVLSSPQSHVSKLSALGYFPGVDIPLLSEAQQGEVEAAAPSLRGLTFEELAANEVPDTNATLIEVIQEVWEGYVAQGSEQTVLELVQAAYAERQ